MVFVRLMTSNTIKHMSFVFERRAPIRFEHSLTVSAIMLHDNDVMDRPTSEVIKLKRRHVYARLTLSTRNRL